MRFYIYIYIDILCTSMWLMCNWTSTVCTTSQWWSEKLYILEHMYVKHLAYHLVPTNYFSSRKNRLFCCDSHFKRIVSRTYINSTYLPTCLHTCPCLSLHYIWLHAVHEHCTNILLHCIAQHCAPLHTLHYIHYIGMYSTSTW